MNPGDRCPGGFTAARAVPHLGQSKQPRASGSDPSPPEHREPAVATEGAAAPWCLLFLLGEGSPRRREPRLKTLPHGVDRMRADGSTGKSGSVIDSRKSSRGRNGSPDLARRP